ncbi:MAG: Peptidase M10A and M12B matrixin and adamalysin, partial [Candidatus Woesebacteria bacterium GW2011_GWC2_47_16]
MLGLSSSIIVVVVLVLFIGGKNALAAWFDEAWAFRRRIPVTNNTTAETNVYITIANVDTSDTAKFQADCGDIRFTKENGQLLDYYIVSGCGTATTTLHVQFDTLIAGLQDIYMYYGNPSAANGFAGSDFSTQASNYSVGSLATEEKSPGPVAYWKFDEGYGAVANNSTAQTGINGTITGATWQTEDKCINGKCLYFTSTNNVSVPDAPNNSLDFGTDSFTISAWVRTGNSAENKNLIRKGAGAGLSGWRFGLSNGVPHFLIGGPSNFTENTLGSTSIADNKWHQLIIVYNRGGNAVGYVDGKQVGTRDISAVTGVVDNSSAITIGNTFATFTGFLDDIRMYNYARSAAQIKADYASRGSSKGGAAVLGGDSDKWLSDGLVGYWKMDEASWTNDCTATSVTDSSGNGNNGKSCPATTGPTGGAAGKFGNAGFFDGMDDYVSAPLNGTTYTEFTYGFWFNTASVTGTTGILQWANALSSGSPMIYVRRNTSNISIYNSGAYSNSIPISANTWYRFDATYKDGVTNLYLNGQLGTTFTRTLTSTYQNNGTTIYAGNGFDGYFNGSIDEVRIYNRALSPKEVRDLY